MGGHDQGPKGQGGARDGTPTRSPRCRCAKVFQLQVEQVQEPRMTGLGMRLERKVPVGRRSPAMTVVDSLIPGFAAHRSGEIMVGDILE